MVIGRHLGTLALATVLFLTPITVSAQTGAIAGTARDNTGSVLPGVSVEVSSPALIEKVRTAVTDGQGQYRITDLRPGVYTATFTLNGFSIVKREGIELSAGFTATINADLTVGALEETVTVTGSSPLVDVQNVTQRTVMPRETIDAIPTAKLFSNLSVLVPGATLRGSGPGSTGLQDVGGASGNPVVRVSIHGSGTSDQQVGLDGYSVSSLAGQGDGVFQYFVDAMVQEYTFETSARNAESGETGGVRTNLVPKEGGNTFSGSFSGNFANSDLQSNNYSEDLKNQGLTSPNRAKAVWMANGGIGGPVKRDRVWFFTAAQRQLADSYVAGKFYNANQAGWTYVADPSRPMVLEQNGWGSATRVTWQVSAKNKLALYGEYNDQCFCQFFSGAITMPEAAWRGTFPTKSVNGTWTSLLSSHLLVQAGASWYHIDPYHLAAQGNGRSTVDNGGPNAGIRYGDAASDMLIDSKVSNVRSSLGYVTGAHNVKAGMDMKIGSSSPFINSTPGNISYTFLNGSPSQVTYSPGSVTQTNRYLPNLGLYAQDQWTLRRLTLNGGLRFDWFRTSYPDQVLPAAQYRPQDLQIAGMEVLNWRDLNPRVGASYDLFGNGNTALKFSWGRYVAQEAVTLTVSANPASATTATQTRTWTDNGDLIIQGDPLNLEQNQELGRSNNQNFGKSVITSRLDPAFAQGFNVRPFNWELAAGLQHQLRPGLSSSVMYYRRWFGNFQLTDNVAVAPTDYDPFCIVAPIDARLPDGGGYPICDLYDVNPTKSQLRDNVVRTSAFYGDQLSHWDGVDVSINARLAHGVIVGGGVSTGKTMTDNCDVVTKVDNPSTYLCHQETPFLVNVKFQGSYTLPWDIRAAATFQSLPGPSIAAAYTARNSEIVPTLKRNLAAGTAGTVSVQLIDPSTTYNERMNQIDLRLAKRFVVRGKRLEAQMDLYNMLNGNAILSQNNTYGTNGASWLVPQSILSARLLKFGVQMDF